jgi:cytochrome b involved in lipid metabolism
MGKAIGAGVVVLVVLGMVVGFERAKQPDANKVLADEVTPTVTEINLQDKLTMAEVAKHNDETSCWTVVDGNVYDLTDFVGKHKGGADKILGLCGADGTNFFKQQHGGQEKPAGVLERLLKGKLEG